MKMILFDLGNTLEAIVNNKDVLMPGALETLQAIGKLKDALGKPPIIALVTNFGKLKATPAQMAASRVEILKILADLKIQEFFEPVAQRVTLSTEAGAEKPSKKIFQHVINKIMGLGFPDVMFITEDSTHVKAARKFKMKAVHFKGPEQTTGDVSKLTDLIPLVQNFLSSSSKLTDLSSVKASPSPGKESKMKLALYRHRNNSRNAKTVETSGASWARFGEEVLVYGGEAKSEQIALAGGKRARRLRETSVPLKSEQMHVVVQNGRMFQREHPTVPVLVDKGRYLLVKLDPKRARQLKDASPTCFGIFPLEENEIVFDVRDAESARVAKVAWISELVNKIKRTSFEPNLAHLVLFGTRHSTSSEFKNASTWARGQFKALTYTTRFQNITVNGKQSRNVIADRVGQDATPRKVVLVTAHLDSVNHEDGAGAPAPGADDNGSGSAGALEMARVFAEHPSQHDVRFILFGGEEQGLFGSLHYVSTLSQPEKKRILSVLNMDMIGTLNTPTQSVMLEGAPLSKRLIDDLAAAAATYTALKVETSLHPFASDHVPFIDAGVPAVLTIEGADNTNGNIHSSRDTINHINYDFALEILRMNVAFIAGEIGRKV